MRSREEVEARWKQGKLQPITSVPEEIEVLLDIRDLLQKPPVEIVNVPVDPTHRHTQSCPKLYGEECNCNSTPIEPPEKDELFDQAAKFATTAGAGCYITANLIRQHLGISYGRASSLIDQLEAHGVITAPDPITHRRKVV